MIKLLFSLVIGLVLVSCGRAQPIEPPHVPTGYLYKVEPGIPGKQVYVCNQRPFTVTGELVGPGNLRAQAQQVFENLKTSLQSVDMTLRNVTQVTYSIRGTSVTVDTTNARVLSNLGTAYFTQVPNIVEMKNVSQLAREDVLIEVEVIAVK
ncbi:RidA family protein [Spirosoma radiotolerans]|uniref:RidA family protein n=1 Tax=Spirosoma radiotolerans TaxID=1379870 RepID=UPI0006976751|nr:Rid family hydrolase [Spirosoma radiotolerans]